MQSIGRTRFLIVICTGALALASNPLNGTPPLIAIAAAQNGECLRFPSVPSDEAHIYTQQEAWLDTYRAAVKSQSPGIQSRPAFGGHLLTADSNRAQALLQSDAMYWVRLSLDRFQELGIRGVTLNIGYPIFKPGVPASDQYLAYYKQVAREIRKRGMTLAVEQIVLYHGSQFSPFDFKFTDLTMEKYTADQTAMAQAIVDNLAPDYLTVMHEPDTVAELTGLNAILLPEVATKYVNDVLSGLHRGRTLVGAGSGSWSGAAYAEAFARNTKVDYIEIHIYWINPFSVDAAYEMARAARTHGKPVVVTEAGLYKTVGEGLEGTPQVDGVAEVYRRDVFSFWELLDMQFLDVTGAFARSIDARYLSVYWTNMFFSYIDWTPATAGMSYTQLNAQLSASQTALAWQAGKSTCAGRKYKAMITGGK